MSTKSLTDVPEQTHDAMQAAAMRPIDGPAAMRIQAAGGGLELPGREKCEGDVPLVGIDPARTHEPIPGERDGTTLTYRQPGAMSGPFNGDDTVRADMPATMSERTVHERIREGGGADAEKRSTDR